MSISNELKDLVRDDFFKDLRLREEDSPATTQLKTVAYMLEKTKYVTLKPLLPLLLSIKGKPYTIKDHFPFEPFFRTAMPKQTVLKTARQLSKSTSIAAQGIIISNGLPYFSTLFVTPLFEQIRRFSQNYVGRFIDDSPVKGLMSGVTTTNNVLQRSFKNKSQMIFSFAYLDAERTRGVSADKNCLVTGTLVTLANGSTCPIERLLPNMRLLSADKNGIIREDIVTEILDQGKQHVFEVTFSNGSIIQCTADERFRKASDGEWVYLSDLVPEIKEIAKEGTRGRFTHTPIGRCFDIQPEAASLGVFTRRLNDSQVKPDCKLANSISSRIKTKRVLQKQGRTIVQFCNNTTPRYRKSRLRKNICCVQHSHQSITERSRRTGNSERQEDRYEGLGRSIRLGSNCVLVYGRWKSIRKQLYVSYTEFHRTGVPVVSQSTTDYGTGMSRGSSEQQETKQNILHHPTNSRSFQVIRDKNSSVDTYNDAIQVSRTEAMGDLLSMQHQVSGQTRSSKRQNANMQKRQLSKGKASQIKPSLYDTSTKIDQKYQAKRETCSETTIAAVRYIGIKQVWDINTQKEHAFFANGILCHNCIDEAQDVDISFLPIIHETMSASPYGICQYTGTPKTLDNTLERLWIESSMAEWVIKCTHGGCNHWNIPALEYDLLDMIGPYRDDISDKYPGLVCAKCRKTINPRPPSQGGTGRWVHRNKDLRWDFAGYHIPQVIMPMHYSNPEKWLLLLAKKEGKLNTPISTFYNEVLGESWDTGSKLITITDLKKAAVLPWPRLVDEAKKHIDGYLYRFVAVDWGGGGISQGKSDLKLQSYTTMAVCGLSPDGRVHVLYGYRSMTPHDHVREAKLVLGLMHHFRCSHVVHDYTGAGTVRETLLRQAGLPINCILPVAYVGPAKTGLIVYKPATEEHPRDHYAMDRNRALNYCCQFIKSNVIRFFQYDHKGSDDPGLLHDFLSLIEDKKTTGAGRDSYKILRDPSGPDDFAQAVTMGSMMLFQMSNHWPNLAMYEDVAISDEVYATTNPTKPVWLD